MVVFSLLRKTASIFVVFVFAILTLSLLALTLASFSNYGKTSVDIAAPGVNILSTLPGNNYGLVSGTSFSAPMVAALLSWYVLFPEPFPSNLPNDNNQTALLPRKEDDKNLFGESIG